MCLAKVGQSAGKEGISRGTLCASTYEPTGRNDVPQRIGGFAACQPICSSRRIPTLLNPQTSGNSASTTSSGSAPQRVPEAEQVQIAGVNTARLYHFRM